MSSVVISDKSPNPVPVAMTTSLSASPDRPLAVDSNLANNSNRALFPVPLAPSTSQTFFLRNLSKSPVLTNNLSRSSSDSESTDPKVRPELHSFGLVGVSGWGFSLEWWGWGDCCGALRGR